MKQLKDILLIFLSAFFIVLFGAMLTNETAYAILPSIPSNTMTSFTFAANTMITASEHNTNNTDLKTGVNETKQYLRDLETHLVDRVDTSTVTGAWTFTPAQTFTNGVTFGGSGGVTNASLLIDADNSSSEVDTKILFQRGSTATDSEIRWDSTDDRFELYTDGSTLSDVQIGNCDSTGEACNFDDVVLDTTNQTVAGVKTYSSAIIQSTECSSSNELCTKSYIDVADAAITAGGCSYGTSVPVGVCMQGACYNLATSSGAIVHYVCSSSGYVATNPYFDSSATFTMSITLSSSGNSITGTPTITGNTQVTGNLTVTGTFALSSSGFNASNVRLTNVGTPTSSTDAATKGYVDSSSPKVWAGNTYVTVSNTTTETTVLTTGVGSKTIAANTLQAGSLVKIHIAGDLTNTSGSNKSFDIRFKLGSDTVQTITLTILNGISNTYFEADCIIGFQTGSASSTVTLSRKFFGLDSAYSGFAADAEYVGLVLAVAESGGIFPDVTASNAVDVTFQWGSSGTGETARITQAWIEVEP